jgi:hypothetical protein
MSIENNLASIAASLATIAEVLKRDRTTDTPAAPVAVPAHVADAPVVAAPAPVAAPVVEAAPAAPVQAAPTCPITDQPSLVAYVMSSYKEMGPVKGNQIQGVLAALGIANINEATAAHYPSIYSGVEALKAQ